VIDGDTVRFQGVVYRLSGFDAPSWYKGGAVTTNRPPPRHAANRPLAFGLIAGGNAT